MEGFLVASSPGGFTLAEDEQKVTQWVWACLSTTGLWMFAISIIQIKFFVWLRHQISCDRREGSKALWRPCQSCMIFIFSPRSFYCYSFWEKQRADCNIVWKCRDRTMAGDDSSCLCDVHVKVYLVFLLLGRSQKNRPQPDVQYIQAFNGGVNCVLSRKCGYNKVWDLGFSP